MIERHRGDDAARAQAVHQASIEVEAWLVQRPAAVRLDARPGDGEAIAAQLEARHKLQVLFVAVIVIVGDVTGLAVEGVAGSVTECVPDGGTTSILGYGTFDLVGRGCRAPEKSFRKSHGSPHQAPIRSDLKGAGQ